MNDVTSDATQVAGQAEPGSTVTVTFLMVQLLRVLQRSGNYTIDIPSNVDLNGGEELQVTATTKNGNTSEPSSAERYEHSCSDAPTVNDVTSDATQVTGQAEPGSTVTVTFLMVQLLRVLQMIQVITIDIQC